MDFLNNLLTATDRSVPFLEPDTLPALLGLWFSLLMLGLLSSRKGGIAGAPERITDMRRALYSGPHEFAPVRVIDLPWLDEAFYDDTQRRLEAIGFRCFGDVENVTLSGIHPTMRTAVREFISGDGVTGASVRQLKIRRWSWFTRLSSAGMRDICIADFMTEFSDGTFLSTANQLGSGSDGDVPGIERLDLPAATPIGESVAVHRRRVEAILAQRPGVTPVLLRDERDIRESEARAHRLKCAETTRNNFLILRQNPDVCSAPPDWVNNSGIRAMARPFSHAGESFK